jgi:hypothetical protein
MGGPPGSNGDKPPPMRQPAVERTALDEVRDLIESRQADEVSASLEEVGAAPSSENDPLRRWKKLKDGQQPTPEILYEGLIAVSQFAEAAIEGGIRMAADLNKALPTIERTEVQARVIASKLETTSSHVHQVDEDIAKLTRILNTVRKDVRAIKDDVADMAGPIRQIPAIKDLLGEILGRLPEPSSVRRSDPVTMAKRRRAKKTTTGR